MRTLWGITCLAVVLVACAGGRLTLSEYGERTEALVADLVEEIDAIDAEWKLQEPTVEGAQTYLEQRVGARVEFLEHLRDLEPPEQLAEMHEAAFDRFSALNAAEETLEASVATFETTAEIDQMWDSPEGLAALAALDGVIELCLATQTELDATQDRETFRDVPWIPNEMKEVVSVAFGCS